MNINRDIIYIKNYVKRYGKDEILNIKEFSFFRGLSYLLVGGNGSGKSTLIKSILGFVRGEGEIYVNTNSIAYLPERIEKKDFLTIEKYVSMILNLDKDIKNKKCEYINKLNDLYEYFDLNPKLKITSLSKGMFQKMNIIITLVLDRKLIILDEPLNGLDKVMQEKFIRLISNERIKGKNIIISTHYPYIYKGTYDAIIKIKDKDLVIENEINNI